MYIKYSLIISVLSVSFMLFADLKFGCVIVCFMIKRKHLL